ncbi:MAG TPA: hypothetical protein VNS63_16385 [Blastocatellia bacterium]|nr:hypothetical protein [Blastocatellia bacterium]
MPRLRETLDEPRSDADTPTNFKTEVNTHGMLCGVCDGLFYVDEATYNQVRSAIEFDPNDNPFRCDECKEEYDEEAVY